MKRATWFDKGEGHLHSYGRLGGNPGEGKSPGLRTLEVFSRPPLKS